MKKSNKKQKAGKNSTQLQVETINFGISEERVRDIIEESKKKIIEDSGIIAKQVAIERLNSFENVLVPKLVEGEMAKCFEKPEIQLLFREAEYTAICTDRGRDYDLLSELLVHRIKRNGNYTTYAAISKAVKDVDKISDDALLGLTIVYALSVYVPISGDIEQGLMVLNDLYGKLIGKGHINISNNNWLDNLEVINALKTKSYTTNKTMEDYLYDRLSGYSCLGINIESEAYDKAKKELLSNGIPSNLLVINTLNEKYVRIPCVHLKKYDEIKLTVITGNQMMEIDLTESQKNVLNKIIDNYYDKNVVKDEFVEVLRKYPYINEIIEWWDSNMIEHSIEITPIGKVIAHTNSKRIDNTLPDLD